MRWAVFAVGLVASLGLTALLWWLGFPGFFLFLLFPLLAFPWRARASARRCPACGWATRAGDARFCPRDGTPLT